MPKPCHALSDLADVRGGYAFRSALEHDPDGDIRVLQMKDVQPQTVITPDNLTAIAWPTRAEPPLLQPGDIAVVARGVSNHAVLFNSPLAVVASNPFFVVSPKAANVLPAYLCWVINLPHSQRQLERSGSAIQALNKASLLSLPIPLPPLAEQHKLLALQALWDEEDRLIERLQATRAQLTQGLYQHLIKE